MCDGSPCPRYYDTDSFIAPTSRQLGNVARNSIYGPALASFDASLQKNFAINEKVGLQFRAEAFNLTNRVNFALPGRTVFRSSGSVQGSAGVIRSTKINAREMQFGLKLTF